MQIQQSAESSASPDGSGAGQARAGDLVHLRGQRWRVTDVRVYERCRALTLSGAGPQNAGVERCVLAPFDLIEPMRGAEGVQAVTQRRWRRAAAALLAEQGPAGQLLTPANARFDLMTHQLEPALAIARGLTCRVLIADEVGLGKTVQAALIVAELLARGSILRTLILTPAGLREQWAEELSARFNLQPAIFDAIEIRRRVAELPPGLNPWQTEPLIIASLDFAKRVEVLPAVQSCRWDLILVDEAHALAPNSDRLAAADRLCRTASHVVLTTATPHSGDRHAFLSLCGVGALTPSGRSSPDTLLVFRRTRAEVRHGPGRRVHQALVRPSGAERHLYQLLDRLAQIVRREHRTRATHDAWFVMTVLYKRALSSAAALLETLTRRLAHPAQTGASDVQLGLPFEATGADDAGDEPPAWSAPLLQDDALEQRILTELEAAARTAAGHETKLAALCRLLRRLRRQGEAAIVFTEYRDTLLHVQRSVRQSLSMECGVLHGALGREARREVLSGFTAGRIAVLLATDAAGEGLNLHRSCRLVINLELPWNPVRLEQRLGRVDRIGQTRRVHGIHLIARDTGEHRLLDRLRHRIELARCDIGAADPLGWADQLRPDEAVPLLDTRNHVPPPRAAAPPPGPSAGDGGSFTLYRSSGEGDVERVRLSRVRRLLHPSVPAPHRLVTALPSRPYIASARRATRHRLHGRILLVARTLLQDAHGHVVSSHLTGVTIPSPGRLARRLLGNSVCGSTLVLSALQTDPALLAWLQKSRDTHRRRLSLRLDREDAIAGYLQSNLTGAFQPALFERRVERARDANTSQAAAFAAEVAARRQMVAAQLEIQVYPPQPVLLLVP